MATVQLYGDRKVGPSPLPGVRLTAAETPESEGAGLALAQARTAETKAGFFGQAAAIGSHVVSGLIESERKRADEVALLDADNQLSSWEHKRLYDPNAGALGVKGQAALPLPEQVIGEYDTVADTIASGLHTDDQKAAFERVRANHRQNLDLTMRRHTFGEMQAFEQDTLSAFVENKKQAAIANAPDPRSVGINMADAVEALTRSAPRLGWSPDVLQAKVEATQTAMSVGVISRMLDNDNIAGAKAYFDHLGPGTSDQPGLGLIKGAALGEIEKALQVGHAKSAGIQLADQVIAAGGTRAEQLAQVKDADDATRLFAEQRIEHAFSLKEQDQRQAAETTLRTSYDILDQTRGDYSAIPARMIATLSGAERSALQSYADKQSAGTKVETDWPTYYTLATMAGKNPNAFVNENLLTLRGKLGDAEFKQLAEMQTAIRKGDLNAADKTLPGFSTKEQLVDDTGTQFGIPHEDKDRTKDQRLMVATIRRQLDTKVTELQAGGKKATNQDMQSEIDRLYGAQFQTLKPGYLWNAADKPLTSITITDIPDLQKAALREALKLRGRPITDATMIDLYIANRMKMGR